MDPNQFTQIAVQTYDITINKQKVKCTQIMRKDAEDGSSLGNKDKVRFQWWKWSPRDLHIILATNLVRSQTRGPNAFYSTVEI